MTLGETVRLVNAMADKLLNEMSMEEIVAMAHQAQRDQLYMLQDEELEEMALDMGVSIA